MQYLRQSTQATIMFGPFVDKADGVTLKTDATTITDIDHATTGIFLSKAGGTAAIRHQSIAAASVADAYGMMKVTLDTTDTNTVGMLDALFAKAATYVPVRKSFMVLPQAVYDSLITGTAAAGGLVLGSAAYQLAVDSAGKVAVPDAQKVDVNTMKTQAVTCAAGVTINANVGAAAAPGAANGMLIAGSNAATTFASLAVSAATTLNSLVVSTTTTLTGVVTASAGCVLNAITGTLATVTAVTNTVAANLTQFLGTVLTEGAAGRITAAFKKFFDIATPASTMDALTLVATATNLTNAPTNGDFTATQKASMATEATIAAAILVTPANKLATGATG